MDSIKLLRVLEFAFSAVKITGKNAGNLQWSQLVEAMIEANALEIPLVLPVIQPNAPVLRHQEMINLNTLLN